MSHTLCCARRRMRALPLLALAALASGYTDPGELQKLLALRTELMKPEHGVAGYLSSWTCPTDGRPCNPCGINSGADDRCASCAVRRR